jgi:hypothetical protein
MGEDFLVNLRHFSKLVAGVLRKRSDGGKVTRFFGRALG